MLRQASGRVMTEGCAEVYTDLIDDALMHLYTDQPDTAPLWSGVYANEPHAVGWAIPKGASGAQLAEVLERAHSFGVGGFATPWMTSEPESTVFSRDFSRLCRPRCRDV